MTDFTIFLFGSVIFAVYMFGLLRMSYIQNKIQKRNIERNRKLDLNKEQD